MPDRPAQPPATGAVAAEPGGERVSQPALQQLNREVERVRAELAQLRQSLSIAQQQVTAERAVQLQEANEKLVLAALHAESIADAAVGSLSEFARGTQRDTLTGIPDRALTLDRMDRAISLAKRNGTQVAVLFIDVDDFKRINDTLGHAVGDATLQLVARRLESVVRTSDTIGRHGGDEFLVVIPDLSQASDAHTVAGKIRAAFSAPAEIGGHTFDVAVSIGLAVYPRDGQDARTLIERADAAMYCAKTQPGTTFRVFDAATLRQRDQRIRRHPVDAPALATVPVAADENVEMRNLRQANEQLVLGAVAAQQVRDRAEARYEEQVRFIAVVAHELRNPLNPIRNAAELLKRVRGDQALLANLQGIIARQVAQMTRLIDDLLDGAKAGAGRLRLQCDTIDLLDVLGIAMDTCRPAMQARHQHFVADLPPAPLQLQGDAFRLAQVFSNLLDNASKYTPRGGSIDLALGVHEDWAVVTVSDDGFGITPDALHRIFELFEQDERALPLQSHGMGIGLAVVRDLVEAHGGSVVATSAGVGRGSRFIVRLPLRGAKPPEGGLSAPPGATPSSP